MKRAHEALDDFLGNRVFKLFLNRTAEVPRAVGHGIGLLDQRINDALVPRKVDPALRKRLPEFREHNARNRAEVFFRELIERDDLVHTVDELRPEELGERLDGLFLRLLR